MIKKTWLTKAKLSQLVLTASLVGLSSTANAYTLFGQHTLNYPGEITTSGSWADSDTSFSYQVSYRDQTNPAGDPDWFYQYTWDSPSPTLSNIIVEVSANLAPGEVENPNPTYAEFRSDEESPTRWGPNFTGNTDSPEDIPGIKWETTGDPNLFTFSFYTNRAPMWGDFIAKGGQITAYNTNFSSQPPALSQDDIADIIAGTQTFEHQTGFVLIPDTFSGIPNGGGNPGGDPIPEPGIFALMGLGLLGLGLQRRRVKSAS